MSLSGMVIQSIGCSYTGFSLMNIALPANRIGIRDAFCAQEKLMGHGGLEHSRYTGVLGLGSRQRLMHLCILASEIIVSSSHSPRSPSPTSSPSNPYPTSQTP